MKRSIATLCSNSATRPPPIIDVILSEAHGSRSESWAESKDPYSLTRLGGLSFLSAGHLIDGGVLTAND